MVKKEPREALLRTFRGGGLPMGRRGGVLLHGSGGEKSYYIVWEGASGKEERGLAERGPTGSGR